MSIAASSTSVKISWAALIAGLGVVTSMVLNYAAYDTRITVLENATIIDQKIVSTLQQDVKTLNESLNAMKVNNATSTGTIGKSTDDINRMQRTLDDMEKRLRDLEARIVAKGRS